MSRAGERAWWREPTRAQWGAFLAAWSGWVLDAFDFTIYILAVPEISREFGVSLTVASGSVTLTLLVRLLGGFVAGAAADRWGRRLPLMLSIIWFALCDGGVAFAPSFGWVLLLRTIFGFGMGAEWTSGTTLAMENWPERSRGIASGILQGSWAIGYLLAGIISAFILPVWGWRGLFLVAVAPAVLVLPIRMFVTESEEWKRKAQIKTRASLGAVLEPFRSRELVGTMLWSSVVMALGFGVYYGLAGPAYPALLERVHGLGPAARGTTVSIFNVGMLVGAIVCGTVAKRRGPLWAIVAPALLMVPLLPLFVGSAGPLALGAFLGGAVGVGFTGVVPLLLTDLFPAEVRARCVGIVYHLGAFAAAFIPPAVTELSRVPALGLPGAIIVVVGSLDLLLAGALLLRSGALRRASPVLRRT